VVAVSLGALILGERLTLTTLLGGAIVVVSVPGTSCPGRDPRMIARIWRGAG